MAPADVAVVGWQSGWTAIRLTPQSESETKRPGLGKPWKRANS